MRCLLDDGLITRRSGFMFKCQICQMPYHEALLREKEIFDALRIDAKKAIDEMRANGLDDRQIRYHLPIRMTEILEDVGAGPVLRAQSERLLAERRAK